MYVMYVHARASTLSLQLGKFPSGFRCLLLGHEFSLRAVNPDIKWPRDLLSPLPSVYFSICDEANIVKVPSGMAVIEPLSQILIGKWARERTM